MENINENLKPKQDVVQTQNTATNQNQQIEEKATENEITMQNNKDLKEWQDEEKKDLKTPVENKEKEEKNNLNESLKKENPNKIVFEKEEENPNKIVFEKEEEKLSKKEKKDLETPLENKEKEQNDNLNENLKKENLNTIIPKKDNERLEKINKKLAYADYLFSSFMRKLLTIVKYKYYEDDILAAKYIKDYKITLNSDNSGLYNIYGNREIPEKDRIYATFYDLYIAFKQARMNYRNYLSNLEDLDDLKEPQELEQKSLNYLTNELERFIKNFAMHNIYGTGNNLLEDFIVNNEFFKIEYFPSIVSGEPIKFKYDCFRVIENVYKDQTHGYNKNNETTNNTVNLNETKKLFKENFEIFNFIYNSNLNPIEEKIPIKTPSFNPVILKNNSYKEKKFLNLKNLFLRFFNHCREYCTKNLNEEKFKNKLDVTYNFLKEENKKLREIYKLILECSSKFKEDFNNIRNDEKKLISKNFIETFFKVYDKIENELISADKIVEMSKKSKTRRYEKEKPKDEDLQFLVEPPEFEWGKIKYAKYFKHVNRINDNLFNEVFERITTFNSKSELSEDNIVYKLLNNLNDCIDFYADSEIDY